MKKHLQIFSLLLILLTACNMTNAERIPLSFSATNYEQKDLPQSVLPLETKLENINSVYVINANTGDILLDVNSDKSIPVASMSKIMTELLVLEAIERGDIDWDDDVTISDYSYTISNTLGIDIMAFEKEKTYTVKDLFNMMAIRSSNGATIALSEHVAGSEKNFVKLMNERAKELKLNQSSFVNSSGLTNHHIKDFYEVGQLNDSNHMSSQDLATLMTYLIDHYPEILSIAKQPFIVYQDKKYENTNFMLEQVKTDLIEEDVYFPNVDGFKTGFTDEAGYGFAGTTTIKGIRIISVVTGTSSFEERFLYTKSIYEDIAKQFE